MRILAINPWIYDFAAYDYWLKPYGFLVLLTYLKKHGVEIEYLDCLESYVGPGSWGRQKYNTKVMPRPRQLDSVPRRYKRYGMDEQEVKSRLPRQAPDHILVTSTMTYWYPAVRDICALAQEHFPEVPLALGGNYASLCPAHAQKNIPQAQVVTYRAIPEFIRDLGIPWQREEFYNTLPDYNLFYKQLPYVVVRTSWGCPLRCSYCAIDQLSDSFIRLDSQRLFAYITAYARQGVRDFAFYDDALLYPADNAKELLRLIAGENLNLRFHTPNAMHLRYLDQEMAHLLKQCGFVLPHFGLDVVPEKLQQAWAAKIDYTTLDQGIDNLRQAGYNAGEFAVYILLGHPDQDLNRLVSDIDMLHAMGAYISLSEYSPVPGTRLSCNNTAAEDEPLRHNNTLLSAIDKTALPEIVRIKEYTRKLNRSFED